VIICKGSFGRHFELDHGVDRDLTPRDFVFWQAKRELGGHLLVAPVFASRID
jgi:hypothetical protein